MSITLHASCPAHPRYEAKSEPRKDCEFCQSLYTLLREYRGTARVTRTDDKGKPVKTGSRQDNLGVHPTCARSFSGGIVIQGMLVGLPSDELRGVYGP